MGFGGSSGMSGGGLDSTRGLDKHGNALKTYIRISRRLDKNAAPEIERGDEQAMSGATPEAINAYAQSLQQRRDQKTARPGRLRRLRDRLSR